MKKNILRIALMSVLAAAIATPVMAQQTNVAKDKSATAKPEPVKAEKKQEGLPFKGTVAKIDKDAKTLTVGDKTFQITSETKIKKAGKDATLESGVVGEEVALKYKTAADGKLTALSVRFGPKAEGEMKKTDTGEKKEKKAKKSQPGTE